jgi:hypothetical protein
MQKPKPGEMVVFCKIPPGFLDDLPKEDCLAIEQAIGKPVRLNEYDESERSELEFRDASDVTHFIYVTSDCIAACESEG